MAINEWLLVTVDKYIEIKNQEIKKYTWKCVGHDDYDMIAITHKWKKLRNLIK